MPAGQGFQGLVEEGASGREGLFAVGEDSLGLRLVEDRAIGRCSSWRLSVWPSDPGRVPSSSAPAARALVMGEIGDGDHPVLEMRP
jgi:hypothetical protein